MLWHGSNEKTAGDNSEKTAASSWNIVDGYVTTGKPKSIC